MGNRYREPRPLSPERLSLHTIDSVKHEDYAVEVQATFLFDPYTPDCNERLSRAVEVLSKVISDSSQRAERKRERKSRDEYAGVLNSHKPTENGTSVAEDEGTGVHVESCRDYGCFGCEDVAQRLHDFFDNS
jgi:hypothetical protein